MWLDPWWGTACCNSQLAYPRFRFSLIGVSDKLKHKLVEVISSTLFPQVYFNHNSVRNFKMCLPSINEVYTRKLKLLPTLRLKPCNIEFQLLSTSLYLNSNNNNVLILSSLKCFLKQTFQFIVKGHLLVKISSPVNYSINTLLPKYDKLT